MRKKMLLWVIRLIRLFHKEDQFIPQLRSVPEGKVLPNRLYRHFGRILVSRANPQKVEMRYYYAEIDPAMSVRPKDDDWKECSEIHYNELMTRKDAVTKYEQTGEYTIYNNQFHRIRFALLKLFFKVFHVIVLFQGEP